MKTFNKFLAASFISLLTLSGGFAQSGTVAMPSAPAMPSVSAPAVGNGFYIPGSAGFYTGQKNVPATTPKASQEEKTEEASFSASAGYTKKTEVVSAPSSPAAPVYKDTASYSVQTALSNMLTASQISSMDQMGLMGNLSGLLGKNNPLLSISNGSDQLVLKQILTQLEELKKRMPENGASASATPVSVKEKAPEKAEPSVLRFLINGYSVLGSCKTIYFSKPENDGSFLLTGDRKYMADGKLREETFYFLFHATGTKNSSTVYSVTPSLSQDYENTSSLFYKLCQISDLTASRTGNLVTLKYNNGVRADVLIGLE